MRYWKINPERQTIEEITGVPDIARASWIADQICLDFEKLQQFPAQGGYVFHGPEPRDPRGFIIGTGIIYGLSIYEGKYLPEVRWHRKLKQRFRLRDEDMPFVNLMSESWRRLLLSAQEGSSYVAIAADTFLPVGTVKSRIHRMRAAIIDHRAGKQRQREGGMFS